MISVAVRHDPVSGQRTLFALQCSGHLVFSEIRESFNSSYDNKRRVTSYISLWDNQSGDVRGIAESGVLNELALQYTWDGTIPKQLPVK